MCKHVMECLFIHVTAEIRFKKSKRLLVPVLMLNERVLVSLPVAVLANVVGKVPTEQGPAKSKRFIIHSIFWMQNFLIIGLCLH